MKDGLVRLSGDLIMKREVTTPGTGTGIQETVIPATRVLTSSILPAGDSISLSIRYRFVPQEAYTDSVKMKVLLKIR